MENRKRKKRSVSIERKTTFHGNGRINKNWTVVLSARELVSITNSLYFSATERSLLLFFNNEKFNRIFSCIYKMRFFFFIRIKLTVSFSSQVKILIWFSNLIGIIFPFFFPFSRLINARNFAIISQRFNLSYFSFYHHTSN